MAASTGSHTWSGKNIDSKLIQNDASIYIWSKCPLRSAMCFQHKHMWCILRLEQVEEICVPLTGLASDPALLSPCLWCTDTRNLLHSHIWLFKGFTVPVRSRGCVCVCARAAACMCVHAAQGIFPAAACSLWKECFDVSRTHREKLILIHII